MRKIIILSLAAGATLMAGGAAFAQGPAPARPAPGADITRAQVQERATATFARMDANKDGKIDAADREVRQRARFDRLDADKNGAISFAEFTTRPERPERAEARPQGEPGQRAERRRGRGHRGGGFGMFGPGPGAKDGMTQAEFVAAALARFDQADTDRNGVLTQAERKAARPERPERGPRGERAPRPAPSAS
ncbi:hypothetical protein GRI97_01515 [Altererythrobacter xixiisoli]|uniref:EF-hand domain-containing protein n=1 Tax=Croceibacterium xixiisoli TaxID=1476466 RepID=A0A6I4TNL1_9SPHN|nr:EF-hand domain-containing protein [Croceibacterium xixiisoli]MXO97665.1 hypothetical protein [Croceibacterium xixiisoli]